MAKKSKVLSKGKKQKQAPKDFAKVKNKVGKSKKAASNDTKTDFKVRKVQLTSQSALEEKGDEVTHRKLGLLELLGQLQHHSNRVRRDAVSGLHELCREHDGVLRTNLARIIDATSMIAIDSSAEVRSAFRDFQAWLLDAVQQKTFEAFASTLALQVRSALSHVSNDVREDGLRLLELYLSKLGSNRVLSRSEAAQLVETLCHLNSHAGFVLPCLLKLLPPLQLNQASGLSTSTNAELATVQVSLQDILEGNLQMQFEQGGDLVDKSAVSDSQIWAFCLRAWLQSGDLSQAKGGRAGQDGAGKPGWIKLRAVAVLERSLEVMSHAASSVVGTSALRPSAAQVATLSGIVRRGEWPLRVDASSPFRVLTDSVNLRMARVFALLAAGGAPPDIAKKHIQRLADASLLLLEEFAQSSQVSMATNSSGIAAVVSSTAASNASVQSSELEAEVRLTSTIASISYALRTLDLLWSCVANTDQDLHCKIFGQDDVVRLVKLTAVFATGSDNQDVAPTSSMLLSVPLTAGLLGLRPTAIAPSMPAALRSSWPASLARLGEPCLAREVEEAMPGTATVWCQNWPKLLWHLAASDQTLSAFLVSIVLELCKRAAQPECLHKQLLSSTLPLLVPFIAGLPGVDAPPPLAMLAPDPDGPQVLAVTLLQYFPRMSEKLAGMLCKLICNWSEVGAAADSEAGQPYLGADCCELILEAVLRAHEDRSDEMLVLRMKVAARVLRVLPKTETPSEDSAIKGERCAVRMTDAVAGWLMEQTSKSSLPVEGLSLDDQCHLSFQSMVWPLVLQLLDDCPQLAPRALSFFFFCAVRLPSGGSGPTIGSMQFLRSVFDSFAVRNSAQSLHPRLVHPADSSARRAIGVGRAKALQLRICEHTRGDGTSRPPLGKSAISNEDEDFAEGAYHLAQMFVTAWMRCVPISKQDSAYELLVKLCAQRMLEFDDRGDVTSPCEEASEHVASRLTALACTFLILADAIQYRNAKSLGTSSWGSMDLGTFADARLASISAAAMKAELQQFGKQCLQRCLTTNTAKQHFLQLSIEQTLSVLQLL